MNRGENVFLSILVISHNQVNLLSRCIDSILQQKIDYPYEIIISDDRSIDGTWELIMSYQKRNPQLIRSIRVNSDLCNPVNNSERCGYNKLSAYNLSKGKYFVNIDADDYLIGTDIYQKQIEMLENHPECSMCMQQVCQINDGDTIDKYIKWPVMDNYHNGQILSAEEVILKGLRALNQCYMVRRNICADPNALYGKHFDDTVITYHHLQFGKVVFLDRADYVWVQYSNSINASLNKDDRILIYNLLPVHHVYYIPKFTGLFLKAGLSDLIRIVKIANLRKLDIDISTRSFLSEFEGFIFDYLKESRHNILGSIRMYSIRILCLFISALNLESVTLYRLLYCLLINYSEMKKISQKYWLVN